MGANHLYSAGTACQGAVAVEVRVNMSSSAASLPPMSCRSVLEFETASTRT
jgi:hypothetical protein